VQIWRNNVSFVNRNPRLPESFTLRTLLTRVVGADMSVQGSGVEEPAQSLNPKERPA
jgi:hypothetical protein